MNRNFSPWAFIFLLLFSACGKDSGNPANPYKPASPEIFGTVVQLNGAGASGFDVALTGAAVTRSSVSDSLGQFSFSGLPTGSYTIKVSKSDYIVEPGERTVNLGQYGAQLDEFLVEKSSRIKSSESVIFGWVRVSDGASPGDIDVVIRERGTGKVIAPSAISGKESGNNVVPSRTSLQPYGNGGDKYFFKFHASRGQAIVITPMYKGFVYEFTPAIVDAALDKPIFTCSIATKPAKPVLHAISGRVLDTAGKPLHVQVVIINPDIYPLSTYSDRTTGEYKLSTIDGQYTILFIASHSFAPDIHDVTVQGHDVTLPDVVGTYTGPTYYILSGRVIDISGSGIPGVQMLIDTWVLCPETGPDGGYEERIFAGSGPFPDTRVCVIHPVKPGYSFSPESVTVTLTRQEDVIEGDAVTIPTFTGYDYTLLAASEYFPLISSSSWTYERTVNSNAPVERSVTISGGFLLDGLAYQQFSPDGPAGMSAYRTEGNSVYVIREHNRTELLRFGVIPGAAWDAGKADGEYPVSGTFLGLEDASTPAGTYSECLKYEVRIKHGDTTHETWTMWYARGIGMVRSEKVFVNYGEVKERIRDELKSYKK